MLRMFLFKDWSWLFFEWKDLEFTASFFFLSFIFFVNGVLATVNPTEQNQGFSIFLCEACSGLKAVLHDYSWSCEV